MSETFDLNGKLLIATPEMTDDRFALSVVYMCAYSSDGAMGLIINKPSDELHLAELLEQLSIEVENPAAQMPIYFGGPVETGRGFVLHDPHYHSSISTMVINDTFSMTATLDILEDIAEGRGPTKSIIALGYAGWGPGQLENEIAENGWLICDASPSLVFDTNDTSKWEQALHSLGINPLMLSATGGHA